VVFSALGHPMRREILRLLATGERSASALAQPFETSRPAVSQHLRVLREAGLVTDRKVGRHQIYALRPERLAAVDTWLDHFRVFWPQRLRALERILTRRRHAP
jgi:DNA-binding transcriptional ArsR family regulator